MQSLESKYLGCLFYITSIILLYYNRKKKKLLRILSTKFICAARGKFKTIWTKGRRRSNVIGTSIQNFKLIAKTFEFFSTSLPLYFLVQLLVQANIDNYKDKCFSLLVTHSSPLPWGVISATNSSTVTFSSPLRRIISLQYSFNSSFQPL